MGRDDIAAKGGEVVFRCWVCAGWELLFETLRRRVWGLLDRLLERRQATVFSGLCLLFDRALDARLESSCCVILTDLDLLLEHFRRGFLADRHLLLERSPL